MKRKDLIHHLEKNGCEFLREGRNLPFLSTEWKRKYPLYLAIVNLMRTSRREYVRILEFENPEHLLAMG